MVHVAQEMERRGIELPLLIGGATTSKQHTAVRIAPAYSQPTVHVLDASRVVATVASLLDPGRVGEFDRENRELQERLREQHAERDRKPLLPIAAARANPHRVSFADLSDAAVHGHADRRARPRDARPVRRLAVLLPRLGAEGQVPGDPRAARRRASCTTTRSRCSRRSRSSGRSGPAACTASGRPARTVTTSSSTTGRGSASSASSPTTATRGRTAASPTTSLRRGDAIGAFAVGVHGAGRARRRGTRPSTTTTARSWSRRSPTGSPRRLPSGCTPRRRQAWYAPGRGALERGADRRALPRDPARIRLPGLSGPQREGEAVRAARRRRTPGSS